MPKKVKHRKSAPPIATIQAEPTRERLAKTDGYFELRGDRQRKVMTVLDNPIERALMRRVITQRQYDAAVKYRLHYHRAGLAGALQSVDPNRIFAPDPSNFSAMAKTEDQAFHREQYRAAILGNRVREGHELRDGKGIGVIASAILDSVVCEEYTFEETGRKLGWKYSSKAIKATEELVSDALDKLARLWGI